MIYLDSCALVKLIIIEEASSDLETYLDTANARGVSVVSSQLAIVEVHRALTRNQAEASDHAAADTMLQGYARLPLAATLATAARLPGRHLRSLDALHVATAQLLGPALTQFITYDKRLLTAAQEAGLPVLSPGWPV